MSWRSRSVSHDSLGKPRTAVLVGAGQNFVRLGQACETPLSGSGPARALKMDEPLTCRFLSGISARNCSGYCLNCTTRLLLVRTTSGGQSAAWSVAVRTEI